MLPESKVISANTKEELEIQINDLINEGWEISVKIIIMRLEQPEGTAAPRTLYLQKMVKKC
jgi:hypothetical protein